MPWQMPARPLPTPIYVMMRSGRWGAVLRRRMLCTNPASESKPVRSSRLHYCLLYSLWGFRYCDWLLAPAGCAAWKALLDSDSGPSLMAIHVSDAYASIFSEIERRVTKTLAWVTRWNWLIDIALDHLTLARVGLIRAILTHPRPQADLNLPHVAAALEGLRNAGQMDELAKGLLTAALYQYVRGDSAAASAVLAEAQEIAERGPMPMYLADIHLHRARMFRDKAELAKAAKLIRELGYGRRDEELADAEAALRTV
jgi:hypothetical protein